MGNGYWEAAGTWRTHHLSSCQPRCSDLASKLTRTRDSRHVRMQVGTPNQPFAVSVPKCAIGIRSGPSPACARLALSP
jgi:hypothetical protein